MPDTRVAEVVVEDRAGCVDRVEQRIHVRDVLQPLRCDAHGQQHPRKQQDGQGRREHDRCVGVLALDRQRDGVRDRSSQETDQTDQQQHDHHAEGMDAQAKRERDQDQDQRLQDDREHVAQRAAEQQRDPADRRDPQALDDPHAQL